MDDKDCIKTRNFLERLLDLFVGQISIFINAGMSRETFKSINSVFPKSFQIRNIPRNRATPEADVNRELPLCCNSLNI